MKKSILFILLGLIAIFFNANARTIRPIEGAYYGTNYTVPFAHAYRALSSLGVDHREAIDRDVYHMSRLGFNAFRLHLWDVELTDSIGNLLDNEHLQLLDYLISQLEKRNIKIILTAQTNFGNGYPERNSDPYGAFSYRYDKCQVHSDHQAIAAQENYIRQLVRHVNPLTGLSYAADPSIIAMEINNEPCHGGDPKQVTKYINTMAKAMRKAGWDKTVLYNVSHNGKVAHAYFDADIDGTTYQWYPLNLVNGEARKGNFLPFVDQYEIPFKNMPNYDKLSRIVYEFDPADNLLSYLFPAAARTFRKEGFQWATQFAYDPIDMAWANTEYQTHYLNLAYTPSKAIGMMIAAEVMRQIPEGADFGSFPNDTIFGPFLLSAQQDLAILNDGKRYYHTNPTSVLPVDTEALISVAGVGNSPIVNYEGSGAYFIDKIGDEAWRVEIMPDVILTHDPFSKPSLNRRVAEIVHNERQFKPLLPGLRQNYQIRNLSDDNLTKAENYAFNATPGVYLIGNNADYITAIDATSTYGDGTKRINEYVAPASTEGKLQLVHKPATLHDAAKPLLLDVQIVSQQPVDSLVLYPGTISFWKEHNDLRKFADLGYGHYQLEVEEPANLGWNNPASINYSIIAWQDGKATSFPSELTGIPLDWDYDNKNAAQYSTSLYYPSAPLRLLTPSADMDDSQISTLPTQWDGTNYIFKEGARLADDQLMASIANPKVDTRLIVLKDLGKLSPGLSAVDDDALICIETDSVSGIEQLELALITSDGYSYNANIESNGGIIKLKAEDFTLSPTLLCPEPFPSFLGRVFYPDASVSDKKLNWKDIENLQIIGSAKAGIPASFAIRGIWIE